MHCNLESSASETYKLKMATFKNGQPEYFLVLTKNFKTTIDRTGTTTVAIRISYIRNMIYGEALREF